MCLFQRAYNLQGCVSGMSSEHVKMFSALYLCYLNALEMAVVDVTDWDS